MRLTYTKGEPEAPMKSDVEKTIDARITAAFADILPDTGSRDETLKCSAYGANCSGKIYAALPKDKSTIPEYFLDAKLEQFLNEAIEGCHARTCSRADWPKTETCC